MVVETTGSGRQRRVGRPLYENDPAEAILYPPMHATDFPQLSHGIVSHWHTQDTNTTSTNPLSQLSSTSCSFITSFCQQSN